MIWLIARKELVEMGRDKRFVWATATVLAFLTVSLVIGWRHYSEVRTEHEAAQRAERERWLHKGDMNPHTAAHYGEYVFKPQQPLSVIDSGVDPYLGVTARLEAHGRNVFEYKPVEDSTSVRRFGEMTAAITLQMLIPLLLILLLFTAFVGEREQGTLRQLLSLGVPHRDLAMGKVVGAAIPLLLFLLPLTIAGVVILWINIGAFAWPPPTGPRIIWMVLAYLLYFAIFIGLSLCVSARAKSSRQALVVLLAFWFINCLAASQAVADVSRFIYPTPSTLAFRTQMREEAARNEETRRQRIEAGLKETDGERIARLRKSLEAYGVRVDGKQPATAASLGLAEGEEAAIKLEDRYFTRLYDAYDHQNRVYQAGGLFAPMLAVQSLSMGLAGTDFKQHRHFADAAEDYRRYLVQSLNWDLAVNDTPENRRPHPLSPSLMWYQPGEELWVRFASFEYTAPSTAWVLNNYRMSIATLLIWFLAVAAITWAAVSRVRVG